MGENSDDKLGLCSVGEKLEFWKTFFMKVKFWKNFVRVL